MQRTDSEEKARAEIEALRSQVKELQAAAERQRRTEDELRQDVELYRTVFDKAVDGIITIDDSGTALSFNPAAERIFGYTAAEVVGRNINMLMPDPYRGEHDGYLERFLRTGEKQIIGVGREVTGRRKDGSEFPMDLAVSVLFPGGKRRFTGIVRDITGRKELEGQLLQAQKMESVGQLAGGIAHDFNNQLGIILFDVDLLLETVPPDDPAHADLEKIRKVVMRSAELTRKLLLFSRRQHLEQQALNLNRHITEMQKVLSRLLREDIAVELSLAPRLSQVSADPGSVDQLLINLAVNARDAMPDGGRLFVETDNVEVDAAYCRVHSQARPGRFVRLCVRDEGAGMDHATLERVFEPFFTTKAVGKGTGLGLAVVYGIVEAHGGWITVESRLGRGSRFDVFLPRLAGPLPELPPEAGDSGGSGGSGERILLIEDQTELSERAQRALTRSGYVVRACPTLEAARDTFREHDGQFDLILADVVLPDGRGSNLVLELRRENPDLAALLITGYSEERLEVEDPHVPGVAVLQKPFSASDLLQQVRLALSP